MTVYYEVGDCQSVYCNLSGLFGLGVVGYDFLLWSLKCGLRIQMGFAPPEILVLVVKFVLIRTLA